MRCNQCGAELPSGVKFCTACGAVATPEPGYHTFGACLSCGAALTPGLAFCTNCGAPVGSNAPVAPAYRYAPQPIPHPASSHPLAKAILAGVAVGVLLVGIAGGGIWWSTQGGKGAPAAPSAAPPAPSAIANLSPTPGQPTPMAMPSPTSTAGPVLKIPGKVEIKDPDPGRLIKTSWGVIPANHVGVILKEGQTRQDAGRIASELGGSVVGEIEYIRFFQVETKTSTEAELKAALDKAGGINGVELAFPNGAAGPNDTACKDCSPYNDPVYQGNNGVPYQLIGVQRAWAIIKAAGITLNDVQVGVLDTAIVEGDDELDGEVILEGDKHAGAENIPADNLVVKGGFNHGTMVTHVIGANSKNGGISGIASPLGPKIKIRQTDIYRAGPDKIPAAPDPVDLTKITEGGNSYILRDIKDMIDQINSGSTVINCSFGAAGNPGPQNAAMAAAYRKFLEKLAKDHPKVTFVAAAGNSNAKVDGKNDWPGGMKLPNLITVGAIDNSGRKAGFSNSATGDGEVTISAPGVQIPMHVGPTGRVVSNSGTSFSAPMVTAAVAILKSINPSLTAEQVKKYLTETAAPGVTGKDQSVPIPPGMGAGVLRVDEAVIKLINDMRKEAGLPPLDPKRLEQLASIKGTSVLKKPTEYTIKAALDAVDAGKPADVTIKLMGQGALSGNSRKTLTAPGDVSWDLTLADPKNKPTIRLCRMDTDACCDLSLNPADVAGKWEGLWRVTSVFVAEDIEIKDDSGRVTQTFKKEDCEKKLLEDNGKDVWMMLEFIPETPESGKVAVTSRNNSGKDERSDPIPYRVEGDQITFEASGTKGLEALPGAIGRMRFVGKIADTGATQTISGEYTGELVKDNRVGISFKAVVTVSRPAR